MWGAGSGRVVAVAGVCFVLVFLVDFIAICTRGRSSSTRIATRARVPRDTTIRAFPAGARTSDTCVEGSFTTSMRVCRGVLGGRKRSSSVCCGLNGDCCGVGGVTGTILGCRHTLLLGPKGDSVHFGLRLTQDGAMSGMVPSDGVFFIA